MSKINLTASNRAETRILDYLEANASDVLAEKINAGGKTLAGAVDYAKEQAKAEAKGASCICVDDETVFGWVVHFFEEDEIAEKKKPAVVRAPGGAKVDAKPTPAKSAKVAPSGSLLDDIFG